MPRLAKPLAELQVSRAKVKNKPYSLADGSGLNLTVSAAGRKAWACIHVTEESFVRARPRTGEWSTTSGSDPTGWDASRVPQANLRELRHAGRRHVRQFRGQLRIAERQLVQIIGPGDPIDADP